MGSIVVETLIRAPQRACFDAARDIGAHLASARATGERVVPPGRMQGLLELGDTATFEGRHFGVRQRFTLKIVEIEPPHRFVDELVKSAFRSLRHVHEFIPVEGGTLMRDTLDWISPFGILGRIADRIFVERGMRRFVTTKQRALAASFDKPRHAA